MALGFIPGVCNIRSYLLGDAFKPIYEIVVLVEEILYHSLLKRVLKIIPALRELLRML